jgi:hypothetical protein
MVSQSKVRAAAVAPFASTWIRRTPAPTSPAETASDRRPDCQPPDSTDPSTSTLGAAVSLTVSSTSRIHASASGERSQESPLAGAHRSRTPNSVRDPAADARHSRRCHWVSIVSPAMTSTGPEAGLST